MRRKVVVIGQGYVGLPMSIAAARANNDVIGLDINKKLVNNLNLGISIVEGTESSEIKKLISTKNYRASCDFSDIRLAEVIIVCVPTPLNQSNYPDLEFIISATKSVGQNLSKGALVIIESTVAPGTTRGLIVPLLEKESGFVRGDFLVAYSPERIDPQNKKWDVSNTPKLLAGLNKESFDKALDFYSEFIQVVTGCDLIEVAETAKLLENSFRLINISFINEFSIFCHKLGIDTTEVIQAASTKPFGFMPFYPSIGVGGHCIPVDPIYLSDKARQLGAPTRMIDLADQINKEMPSYFVSQAEEKIGGLKGRKILILGVAYKPNVADIRNTPVESLINELKQKGAQVSWHDELVGKWNGGSSVAISSDFDLVILATPHDYFDLTKLGNVPILNTLGSLS